MPVKYIGRTFLKKEGVKRLQDIHGINSTSASFFIDDYRHLLKGEEFKRALSADAMDYFLTRIADHGLASLATAVRALQLHIIYRETKNKVSQRAMRKILSTHKAKLMAPRLMEDIQSELESSVKEALDVPLAELHARLKDAPRIPRKVQATTYVFYRNANVIAFVLRRAAGVCERCKKRAPFMRTADNTPHLEVHHVKQLANGGEDKVENAIALCPNCHRELHFGAAQA